jgi:hypothetical protein
MIAIMPHAGEPDGDEDHLDREGNGGESVAHTRIRSLVQALNHHGPSAARQIKLYATALIHMADAHTHRDEAAFDEACDEAADALHELRILKGNERGSK